MESIISDTQNVLLAVVGLAIMIVAISLFFAARKASYSDTARVGFNVVVGSILVAISFGAIGFAAFGEEILASFGIN